jgi:hypothetical protein
MRKTMFFFLAVLLSGCDSPDDEALLEDLGDADAADVREDAEVLALEELSAGVRPVASGCQYKVIWPTAGVYEKPGWWLLKTKGAGDIVGASWCDWTWYDGTNEWLAVATASAEDGVGWVRRSAVVKM